ncbi:hypothetical protein M8J76_013732 [Diaphorina citri]|nr:hypothetical protein M8J76_013732 [Diaphorina citri]KAI5731124.1 hypothetical protein M8J77_004979 [Diaphorina citri]
MAIPFCLPSDEETEDHYRRLEQLLADIYEVLRIILTRQHPHLAVQANFHDMSSGIDSQGSHQSLTYDEEESLASTSPSIEDVHQRLAQLPDLVLSTLPSQPRRSSQSNYSASSKLLCPPRVPPRKYKKKSKGDVVDGLSKDVCPEKALLCPAKTMTLPEQSWNQVGKELRTIADSFRSNYKKTNKGKEPIDLPALKASSLLSLLLPTPLLNRSVWTTVLFIVGWRILLRQR